MNTFPGCYGAIFPDLRKLQFNRMMKGKVFSVLVENCGVGIQRREINADPDEWEKCTRCEHYRTCYDFSFGKLALCQATGEVTF